MLLYKQHKKLKTAMTPIISMVLQEWQQLMRELCTSVCPTVKMNKS